MSIRIRLVDGIVVALCAARSMEKPGDLYLDDTAHHALAQKFARDWDMSDMIETASATRAGQEESNNPNRVWWDKQYGGPTVCPRCGQGNACGMVAGQATCWCSTLELPAFLRAYGYPSDRCLCEACVKELAKP